MVVRWLIIALHYSLILYLTNLNILRYNYQFEIMANY